MPRVLTILHTEGSRRWGGQEIRVLEECLWMQDHGHRAVLACPPDSILSRRATTAGIEHHPIHFSRSTIAGDLLRMGRLLRELQPEILNTHGNLDSKVALLAALGLRVPLVLRTRHSIPPVRPTFWNLLFYRRLCHLILCTAECSRLQLIRDLGLDPHRVFTLPTGIRPPLTLPVPDVARQTLADELRLDPASRFVGYVGRLRENKGLTCLLEAFAIARDRLPRTHLVLVGAGSFLDNLRRETARLGLETIVHFPGYREDPWPCYRAFGCHVTPTPEFEGISQAARQAMFAGCPVVASNIGGLAEIIRHPTTGLLVPPGNPAALADAILQVFAEPEVARARARAALDYVQAEHTLDRMGLQTLDIYSRHLELERPPRPRSAAS